MIHEFYHENHNLEKIIDYEIYTDGSCKGQVFGGWAFMVLSDSKLIAEAVFHEHTCLIAQSALVVDVFTPLVGIVHADFGTKSESFLRHSRSGGHQHAHECKHCLLHDHLLLD